MRSSSLAAVVLACWGACLAGQSPAGPERPTFRSGVDLVTMTAIVHDRAGRPVQGLSLSDFELLDAGERRTIVDFSSETAAASVAILLDVSGSMAVSSKLADARAAMAHLESWLVPGKDEVAVYTFDSGLHEQRPFGPVSSELEPQLPPLKAFGSTSLYDAIAQVAQRALAQGRSRRVVVVLTDGVDTSSQLSAPEVSRIASATDVPVYVIGVVTSLDVAGVAPPAPAGGAADAFERPLEALADWTGGRFFITSVPAEASAAARQIAAELHHQYLIAFEPGSRAGWHPLTLRTRQKGLYVRTRGGYVLGSAASHEQQSTRQ